MLLKNEFIASYYVRRVKGDNKKPGVFVPTYESGAAGDKKADDNPKPG